MELLIGLLVGCVTGLGAGSALWLFPQKEILNKKNEKITEIRRALEEASDYNSQFRDEIEKTEKSRLMTLQKMEESLLEKSRKWGRDQTVMSQALNGGNGAEY